MLEDVIEDEYKIAPILNSFNVDYKVYLELTAHLDKTLGVYLKEYHEARKSAFTEITVCLQKALFDCKGDDSELRSRVVDIIKSVADKGE